MFVLFSFFLPLQCQLKLQEKVCSNDRNTNRNFTHSHKSESQIIIQGMLLAREFLTKFDHYLSSMTDFFVILANC